MLTYRAGMVRSIIDCYTATSNRSAVSVIDPRRSSVQVAFFVGHQRLVDDLVESVLQLLGAITVSCSITQCGR